MNMLHNAIKIAETIWMLVLSAALCTDAEMTSSGSLILTGEAAQE